MQFIAVNAKTFEGQNILLESYLEANTIFFVFLCFFSCDVLVVMQCFSGLTDHSKCFEKCFFSVSQTLVSVHSVQNHVSNSVMSFVKPLEKKLANKF